MVSFKHIGLFDGVGESYQIHQIPYVRVTYVLGLSGSALLRIKVVQRYPRRKKCRFYLTCGQKCQRAVSIHSRHAQPELTVFTTRVSCLNKNQKIPSTTLW